jgi:hypothetical protein
MANTGEQMMVALVIGAAAFGGALSTSILLERLRTRLIASTLIALWSMLLFNSVPGTPGIGEYGQYLILAIAILCLVAFFGSVFFHSWKVGFRASRIRNWLRAQLIPRIWTDSIPQSSLPVKPLVTRWFVSIAAATGSIVGTLMAQGEFWEAVGRALNPSHLAFTILLTVTSITLIGPLEEYVFGQRLIRNTSEAHREGASPKDLVEDVFGNLSWRAFGRLGLVALFSFQPTILHGCLDEAISKGSTDAIMTVVGAIGPAFTTYYWSAALQLGAPSIARRAGRASTLFSSLLYFPVVSAFSFTFMAILISAVSVTQYGALWATVLIIIAVMIAIVLGTLGALMIGFLFDGIFAIAGGMVLDRARVSARFGSWHALLVIGLIFVVFFILLGLVADGIVAMTGLAQSDSAQQWLSGPLSCLGWMAGLAVSGFPRILTVSVSADPSDAGDERALGDMAESR